MAKLTRDADLRWPDQDERRRYHQAVLATLVARFLSGNDLVATGRVLGAAGAGRNVQVYAADPQVLLDPPVLRVEVTAPPGMAPAPTDGWTVEDGASGLSRRLITTTTATLDLHG